MADGLFSPRSSGAQQGHVCKVCATVFMPARPDRTTCCSRECGFVLKRWNGEKIRATTRAKQEFARWARRAASKCGDCRISIPVGRKYCIDCAAIRSRDSWKSSYARHSAKDVSERACLECLTAFAPTAWGDKRRRFCGDACSDRYHRRVAKGMSRAARYGAAMEPVNPIDVMERDGWRCHICGEAAPRELRGSMAWNAPELDHVIALAAGGTHTLDNVACAHRRCNIEKGDRLINGEVDAVPQRRWTHG